MLAPNAQLANRLRLGCLAIGLAALVLPVASTAQEESADTYSQQYRIDSDKSWLRVLVYRGGLLRGFGHNHVISHDGIRGTLHVGQDPLQSELSLEFDVTDLVVDDPDQRAIAGADFPGRVDDRAVAGTRRNMLGSKLLQAEQYPTIKIQSDSITGILPEVEVEAKVLIRGAEFRIVFPARVELSADSVVASGELEIRHGDLGLKPFKAGLGTLRVRDSMLLQYEIWGSLTDDADER